MAAEDLCWGCQEESATVYHPLCTGHKCCPSCYVAYYRTVDVQVKGRITFFSPNSIILSKKCCPICRKFAGDPLTQEFIQSAPVYFFPEAQADLLRSQGRVARAAQYRLGGEGVFTQTVMRRQQAKVQKVASHLSSFEMLSDSQLKTACLVLSELCSKNMIRLPPLNPCTPEDKARARVTQYELTTKYYCSVPGGGNRNPFQERKCPFSGCEATYCNSGEWITHFEEWHARTFVCPLVGCHHTFEAHDAQSLGLAVQVHLAGVTCTGDVQEITVPMQVPPSMLRNLLSAAFQ
jgi:hypothetical protein